MEDMDIDSVVDVPDTPDRLTIRKNRRGGVEKEITSSVAGSSKDSELLSRGVPNGLWGRSKPITGNGNSKRFYPQREELTIRNGIKQGSSPIVNSLDNTSVFKAHLFKGLAHHNPRLESEPSAQPKHSVHVPSNSYGHGGDRARLGADCSGIAEVLAPDVGIQDGSNRKLIDLSSPKINGRNTRRKMVTGNINLDRGKGLCTEIPSRHSACINKNGVLNLIGRHEHTGIPERACGELKDFMAEEARRGSIPVNGFSSLHTVANSSKALSNGCKGKTKIDDTCTITTVASDHMKSFYPINDSQPNTREMMLESVQPIMSSRRTGQKRLVRNGCISPFNITRAKQTAENHCKSSVDVEQADVGGVITNAEAPSCQINIVRHDSESNRVDIVKGKGVMRDSNPTKEHDVEGMQLPSRDSLTHMEEDIIAIRDGSGGAFRCFEGIGGWRSTRSRSKMPSAPPFDEVVSPSRNDQRHVNRIESGDHVGVEITDRYSLQHNPNLLLVQSSSSVLSESDRVNGQQRRANKLVKRQKKQGSTRSNIGECSTLTPDDSSIAHLLSSGEPLNARSTRRRNTNRHGNSGSVIVIDEFSPETRGGNSVDISQLVDNDSETRARQVEADEILARQLQEQFFYELPGAVGELDANIARTLQQEEDAQHASYHGNLRAPHPRDPSMSHLYRQHPSRPFRNRSVRTTNRAQQPRSTRNGRLRTSSRTLSSGGRSIQFPSDVDFETRIDILEALEAAVGNSNDMRRAGHVFQRDFNENDYELLLALDENNHQHVGASAHHINSLPQSTVQTENFDEACAICLDTPSTGDIIRHLPCLHKFHKDCIDPWLRRKTSCPVCKSSIT
ncbi:E3 ubiquitin-protein ligase RNF6-like isoform X2 [Telopea speciosissima]|nr:E3 ubiquitin-protein ligase RNF6-like isoform X2 [Telopea speciosissima]XP_043706580.1 E3 ubiquitin-protein ligase RNF6-like isoform X2 [Telopea speciosissima]XP_043706581.1 E3 ubiquitin-protein ligase RNF6-like isoform X2 [Telopea speciosissima]